jgi:CSLREA domain-containing protein
MLALGEAILACATDAEPGDGVWYVTLEDGEIVEDVNFGNRNLNEITVTTLDDRIDPNDGLISLREAILLANVIDTVGRFADRVLHVLDGAELHIEALSVTGGNVQGNGGGILNQGTLSLLDAVVSGNVGDYGGGIRNVGQLSIQQSTISGNTSRQTGGGISNFGGQIQIVASTVSGNSATYGGGLWTNSAATISDSTFADNSATPNNGGAVSNASGGTLRIERSTLAGNTANYGGAILTNAPLVIINSTLSGNEARTSGGAIHNQNLLTVYHSTIYGNRANSGGTTSGSGGGISKSTGAIELYHTIVAGNWVGTGQTPQEINGQVEATSSFNLIADAGSSGGLIDGINGNLVGNGGTGTIEANDVLSPTLADYGGPTLTHALIPTSPAIDAGNPNFDPAGFDPPLLTDQRGEGFARILQGRIDIGAFEFLLPYVETAVAVTSSVNPSIYGDSVFLSATVSGDLGTPTGTVQFAVGGADLGAPVPLVDGVAQSPAVSDLIATTHTITAHYEPQLASPFVSSSGQLADGQLVNPRTLTVSGIAAADKVYDGTTEAVLDVSGVVLVGRVSDDDVVLDASNAAGAFEDPDVGSNKMVFISALVITGDDTRNYSLIQPTTIASILASAAARIDMTIVRQPTATDGQGQVAILPDSAAWVLEWQTLWVELWVSTPDTTTLGVAEAIVDLSYDTNYLTAQEIVYGPAFLQAQTGTIDDVAGLVSEIGARTDLTDVGDDAYVLLARVRFTSTGNAQSPVNEAGRSIGPYDMRMELSGGQTVLFGRGAVEPQLGQSPSTELWSVVYDIDDNNQIDFGDFSFFAAAFGRTVGGTFEPPYVWWADFDRSGRVDFGDLAFFAPNFTKSRSTVQSGETTLIFPSNFPDAWRAGTGGGGGEAEGESESESESESEREAAWKPSPGGVRLAASSGGSQHALAMPWQLAWAVDEAHAALQTEPTQGLPWQIAAAQEAQPALPLWQEALGSLYSRNDEPEAPSDKRPERQFEDWQPLEDLLTTLAVR